MFNKPQSEDYLKSLVDASVEVPADTAALLIYDMIAVKDFSAGLTREIAPCFLSTNPVRSKALIS